MAVFSAIGAVIASAIGLGGTFVTIAGIGLSFTGTLVAGVIAGGLGMATSKALGLNKAPNIQNPKDPGTKVQLAPSTDNRIPVFYGRVNTGALIVDAGIKNQNNTMVYCMVIGEKTDAGSYTINKIKRQDATLNFTGGYASASSPTVISITDPNATSSNNVNGKMRCRVFAGNAQSSVNQIFPPLGTKVAAQSLMTTIDATTNYEDLVYAIFEVDYDPENQLTSLGTLTFDISNSLNEPSNVLLDYLKNDRYGAGLSSDDLVTATFDDLYDYSTAQVAYTSNANVSLTHDRWQIDGMLSTYNDVKTNIDIICQSSATYFTYDNKNGKFKVVPNREATTTEKTNAFVFDDDNIFGDIEITSTELYSMYNSIEAEFPDVTKQDQTNTVIVSTPSGDRNTNEPDNPLTTRFELCNDKARVHNLANIDLRQSRLSTVCTFDATYEAIQVDVGDVVKLTSSLYGFSEKLFRCMRVTEKERNDGMLVTNMVLLEYDDSIYTHVVEQGTTTPGIPGIPGWWTNWGNTTIDWPNIIANINVITSPTANANVVDSGTGNVIANVDYANIDLNLPDFSIGGFTPGLNFNLDYANLIANSNIVGGADTVIVSVKNDDLPNNSPVTHIIEPPVDAGFGGLFNPEAFIDINIPLPDLGVDTSANAPINKGFPTTSNAAPSGNANVSIQLKNQQFGTATPFYNVPVFGFAPDGGIKTEDIRDMGTGLQVEDKPAANTTMANSDLLEATSPGSSTLGDANTIIGTPDIIDLGGVEAGDYFFDSTISFGGTLPPSGANGAYALQVTTLYQEKYASNLANVGTNTWMEGAILEGTQFSGSQDLATGSNLKSSGIINVDPYVAEQLAVAAGANTTDRAYVPAYLEITQLANTNLGISNAFPRSGFNRTVDGGRNFKGDKYIQVK